jgi:hypothetical protein
MTHYGRQPMKNAIVTNNKMVLAVLLACAGACGGDDGKAVADAAGLCLPGQPNCVPTPDGAPDALPPPPPVTAIAVFNNARVSGAAVVFRDAAGNILSTKKTDSNGEASEQVPPNGSVTIVPPNLAGVVGGGGGQLTTFMGVQPGDVLPNARVYADSATVDRAIVLPAAPVGNNYSVTSSCQLQPTLQKASTGAAVTETLALSPGCTQASFFVDIRTSATNASIGQFYRANVAIPAAGPIDFSAVVPNPPKRAMMKIQALPSNTRFVSIQVEGFDGKIRMSHPAGSALQAPPTNGTFMGATLVPDIDAPEQVVITSVTRPKSSIVTYDRGAAGDYNLAYNSILTPSVTVPPVVNTATSTVSWTEVDGGAADTVFASLSVNRTAGGVTFGHTIMAPYTGANVVVPPMPTSLSKLDIKSGDNVRVTEFTFMLGTGGYNAVRAGYLVVPSLGEITASPGTFSIESINL